VLPDDELMMITKGGRHHPLPGAGHQRQRPQHAGRQAHGPRRFQYMHQVVREAVRVSDDEIGSAVKHLYDCSGLRVEPSGAVGVAALLHGRVTLTTPTAIVCTGGNIDPALFARLTA
jgi:threonine dehydratase